MLAPIASFGEAGGEGPTLAAAEGAGAGATGVGAAARGGALADSGGSTIGIGDTGVKLSLNGAAGLVADTLAF